MKIRRGDIFLADLPKGMGSEQTGVRPVAIIQNDIGNRYSPVVIVAAITGQNKRSLPTHILLVEEEGLEKPSLLMLESIATIDKQRLIKRLGRLKSDTLLKVDHAAEISLGLTKKCPIELTLCRRCRNQFELNPAYRIWWSDFKQEEMEKCSYCQVGLGYDYFVLKVEDV